MVLHNYYPYRNEKGFATDTNIKRFFYSTCFVFQQNKPMVDIVSTKV